ncbi:MAG: bifunctional DNA primase/polymerase, partial [Phycisphaerae bacterium]|nr:bifunctional DNA primase/polymerase [Phycisphaerae bacterium]
MGDRVSISKAARSYLSAGLCVLSARRAQKRPAVGSWKRYQKRLPTEAELSAWLSNSPDAVCILCGQASGNLEAIDFDAGGEMFSAWWGRVSVELRGKLVVERTPSGGYHVIYRCVAAICGNLKLAQRSVGNKVVTLIETRGEGGLILCAPTAGYEIIEGDIHNPPRLTEAERDVLLQAAWELNEYQP